METTYPDDMPMEEISLETLENLSTEDLSRYLYLELNSLRSQKIFDHDIKRVRNIVHLLYNDEDKSLQYHFSSNVNYPSHLHVMANFQDASLIKLFLEYGEDLELKSQKRGYTPLHYAICHMNPVMVRGLLAAGANPNQPFSDCTPLHQCIASSSNFFFNIEYCENVFTIAIDLIEYGIDIDAKNNDGDTALDFAIKYNNFKYVNLLLAAGATSVYFSQKMPTKGWVDIFAYN